MSDTTSAVSLKLPTFWVQQPEVWFSQAEAQFAIRGIKAEDTRYYYTIAALDQETATRILDLLKNPPTEKAYTALKKRLLETFTSSEYERANKLLQLPPLGDQQPSQLMDFMLGLLGDHPPCFLFRQLFLNRLQEQIRSVLMHSQVADMRDLAKAADRLYQAYNMNEVNKVSVRKHNKSSSSTNNLPSPLCYFHNKFGHKARRCIAPCSWNTSKTENEQAGSL